MASVLVVDDQDRARRLLGDELIEAGFDVVCACDGDDAWDRFRSDAPDVVITDLRMPQCDGIELVRRIRRESDVPVIVFSGHGTVASSADAFKAGADDFVSSLDLEVDDLVSLVRDAADPGLGEAENALAARIAGTSRAATRIRWQIAGLAPLAAPVLVSGETGTGRATVVDALHALGSTAGGALLRVESADFSLEEARRAGADAFGGATALVLVDVEHLSWSAMGWWAEKLEAMPADWPRVFATTSAPLPSLVRSGAFHPELGPLLQRFHIELPPLRDRTEDVAAISRVLLARIGSEVGRPGIALSAAAARLVETSRFPENVRQLERLLERAAAYSTDRVIRKETLGELMGELEDSIASMRGERLLLERERLLRTLQETGGNITRTAEILGKSRAAVYRLLEKHDIPLSRRD